MTNHFAKTLTLLALSVLSTLALADVPGRVGRISVSEGQVNVSAEVGDQADAALVNWPVTSHNQITTARGARTEVRVGSTAIRLDGDSALDVVELDDDTLRLHLHYGSISVRVRNPDVLRGFELSTPQGRVRLQEPGRFRVDAERQPDTSVVNVFEGVATVDGAGSSLTLRAGRRAELQQDDIRTALAVRDGFDDWALLRDRRDERAVSERYVTSEMTGYEELDQNGIWRDDPDYGPLWMPRTVSSGWAPYRDGRWTYLEPWGWTWVDNAPWGYAPFHYGRWVMVNQRWCWAPGRNVGRPVWSPALVGWVGGGSWSVNFATGGTRHAAPAQGWYPLTPRETYVPHYRVSQDHLRYINRTARDDDKHRDPRDQRHEGLTVVPQEHFARRVPVVVPMVPKAMVTPLALQGAQPARPPVPEGVRREVTMPNPDRRDGVRGAPRIERNADESRPVQASDRRDDNRGVGRVERDNDRHDNDRRDNDRRDDGRRDDGRRDNDRRDERRAPVAAVPAPVLQAQPQAVAQPQAIVQPQPQAQQPRWGAAPGRQDDRNEAMRARYEVERDRDRRQQEHSQRQVSQPPVQQQMQQPAQPAPRPVMMPPPVQAQAQPQPQPQPQMQMPRPAPQAAPAARKEEKQERHPPKSGDDDDKPSRGRMIR